MDQSVSEMDLHQKAADLIQRTTEEDSDNENLNWPEETLACASKLVLAQLGTKMLLHSQTSIDILIADLEAFSKHAKRATINVDDVKLALRHNKQLQSRLDQILKQS